VLQQTGNREMTAYEVRETRVAHTMATGNAYAEIQYDDFAKLDLRIAKVITCEKVEKADKLLKLTLEVGTETRTVVSGIALHFTPEEVIGKSVLYLANLAPRKMRGIESQGMILMAENSDGKLYFMQPSANIDSGSGVS
jgi:methionyl-tRNA synthetase